MLVSLVNHYHTSSVIAISKNTVIVPLTFSLCSRGVWLPKARKRTHDLGALYTIEEQKPARTRRTVPALRRHKGGWRTFEYPSNRWRKDAFSLPLPPKNMPRQKESSDLNIVPLDRLFRSSFDPEHDSVVPGLSFDDSSTFELCGT